MFRASRAASRPTRSRVPPAARGVAALFRDGVRLAEVAGPTTLSSPRHRRSSLLARRVAGRRGTTQRARSSEAASRHDVRRRQLFRAHHRLRRESRPRGRARRGGYAPARPTAPAAKSAVLGGVRLPERAARLVVRAENQGLDRDAPELQEKFAIIGCVRARAPPPSTPSRRDTRPAAAHFIHRRIFPHNRSAPQPSSSQVRRTRVPELHVHLRPQERRRLLPRRRGHPVQGPSRRLAVSHLRRGEVQVQEHGQGGGGLRAEPGAVSAPTP